MIVSAALSGSVLVIALWPPLSANQRGIAVIVLSAVLAMHFLLAAGLQLYFFRYSNTAVTSAVSSAHPMAINSPSLDKVTELQPLNLVRDIENFTTTHEIESGSTEKLPVLPKDSASSLNNSTETKDVKNLKPMPTQNKTQINLGLSAEHGSTPGVA